MSKETISYFLFILFLGSAVCAFLVSVGPNVFNNHASDEHDDKVRVEVNKRIKGILRIHAGKYEFQGRDLMAERGDDLVVASEWQCNVAGRYSKNPFEKTIIEVSSGVIEVLRLQPEIDTELDRETVQQCLVGYLGHINEALILQGLKDIKVNESERNKMKDSWR